MFSSLPQSQPQGVFQRPFSSAHDALTPSFGAPPSTQPQFSSKPLGSQQPYGDASPLGYGIRTVSNSSGPLHRGHSPVPYSGFRESVDPFAQTHDSLHHHTLQHQQSHPSHTQHHQQPAQPPQPKFLPSYLMNAIRDSPISSSPANGLSLGSPWAGHPQTPHHIRPGSPAGFGRPRSRSRSPPPHSHGYHVPSHNHHRSSSASYGDEYGLEYGTPTSPRTRSTSQAPPEDAPPTATLFDMPLAATAQVVGTNSQPSLPSPGLNLPSGSISNPAFSTTSKSSLSGGLPPNVQPAAARSPPVSIDAMPKAHNHQHSDTGHTARVVGFPPESAAELRDHFCALGAVRSTMAPASANWMTITYAAKSGLERALEFDQAMLADGSMIAVMATAAPSGGKKLELGGLSAAQPHRNGPISTQSAALPEMSNVSPAPKNIYMRTTTPESRIKLNSQPLPSPYERPGAKHSQPNSTPSQKRAISGGKFFQDDVVPIIRPPSFWSQVLNSVFGW